MSATTEETIMSPDELKAFQKSEPFRPFRIVLNDGKAFDVPHPNFMWVYGGRAFIGTHGDVDRGLCDRHEIVPLTDILRAEPMALGSRKEGNSGNERSGS